MYSDAWENVVTLLGTSYDKSTYHRVYPEVWYDCDELEDLYYGDSYARRAIEEPVDAAFRQGYDLTNEKAFDSETFNEDKDQIQLVLDEHDAVCQLKEALYWGALYGRGGLLLGVDDGQDLETPLDLERVRELKYLEVLQCLSCTSPGSCLLEERLPRYGSVERTTGETRRCSKARTSTSETGTPRIRVAPI
jgi:hypothetical protein